MLIVLYPTVTTLDESEACSVYHALHVEGEAGVNLLGPFFASSTTSSNHQSTTIAEDTPAEHQCPVCLEKMTLPSVTSTADSAAASSSILTTVCNHSFHIDCLARWQDSPCPVCRYDHSGLNDTLSQCHVCSTTVRNYVCLICGVISCATGPSSSSHNAAVETDNPLAAQPSQRGHALRHYEESLHAYALDTETQHVWDFAGGGYVHRLIQNAEDGKIVEGADPRLVDEERFLHQNDDGTSPLSALERSTIPTYSSSAEDDEAVHRKLEGYAGQYYTLLKSQLEQQRIFYEGKLESIRREYGHESSGRESQSTSDLISALKQERNQLEQRCSTLRRKHRKVNDDVMFLKDMNESLENDKVAFRKQIGEAQAELATAKKMTQQMLSPMEGKVHELMLQLTGDDS
jgi:BRCA1-associated protein